MFRFVSELEQRRNGMAREKQRNGMGHLYKRARDGREVPADSHVPGTFWISYTDERGRRVRKRLEDEDRRPVEGLREARRAQLRIRSPYLTRDRLCRLRAIQAEIARLEDRLAMEMDGAEPPLSLAEAWEAFRDSPSRPECGEGTLFHYRHQWERFRQWMAENRPEVARLADVTEAAARAYAVDLSSSGVSGATYNKHITLLRMVFRILAEEGRMAMDPFASIARKKHRPEGRRALAPEELRKILQAAGGSLGTLLLIGASTGLRLGDCCTLRWREVDLEAGVIRRKPRKTERSSGAVVTLGIPGALKEALGCLALQGRGEYVLQDMAEMYLSGKAYAISRRIQRHFRECGLETGGKEGRRLREAAVVGFHSLRHTWVSLHAAAGTPAAVIQKAAGHGSPAMTEYYTHIQDSTARQATSAIDGALGRPGTTPDAH